MRWALSIELEHHSTSLVEAKLIRMNLHWQVKRHKRVVNELQNHSNNW
jgi:hypothetical protein